MRHYGGTPNNILEDDFEQIPSSPALKMLKSDARIIIFTRGNILSAFGSAERHTL